MLNPIYFSTINAYSNCVNFVSRAWCGCSNPSVIQSILCNKITENPVITPSNNTTVVAPSAKNRVLGTVTVTPQTPLYFKMTLSGTNSDSVVIKGADTAISSTPATATVAVSGNAVVVTGVAAGTTVISVFDVSKNLIGTIYITVV